MPTISDWPGGSDHQAWCPRCNRRLGTWPTAAKALEDQQKHDLEEHSPVIQDGAGGASTGGGKGGKPQKLTRDQRRGKYPKPGKGKK